MLWSHPGQAEQREALLERGASAVLLASLITWRFVSKSCSSAVAYTVYGRYRRQPGWMSHHPSAAEACREGRVARYCAGSRLTEFQTDALWRSPFRLKRPTPGEVAITLDCAAAGHSAHFAVLLVAHWDHLAPAPVFASTS
jgi:hypothetical protein